MGAEGSATRNAIVYNFECKTTPVSAPVSDLGSFLEFLKQRYGALLAGPISNHPVADSYRLNLHSLQLAESFLQKGVLIRTYPDHPLQIAVLGPTQSGKSSVVNWLLQTPAAEVSPLAGFTVHPQGFCLGVDPQSLDWLSSYLHGLTHYALAALPRDRYDCYGLLEVKAVGTSLPVPSVLWDTPDFDSVDAEDYRSNVLRIAALADLILLVVSKDKYADQSVWDLISLLQPLAPPILFCLNKVSKSSQDALVESLRDKWRETRSDTPPPIVAVPYLEDLRLGDLEPMLQFRPSLVRALNGMTQQIQRSEHQRRSRDLLRRHWASWMAPVRAEQDALAEWAKMVSDAVTDALQLYRRDYLNHPQHYEAFQRALAELLRLLEVPGLAGALLMARKIVTWPARQLFKVGQSLTRRASGDDSGSTEGAILHEISEHLFIRLSETVLLKRDGDILNDAFWRELGTRLRRDQQSIALRFRDAIGRYREQFRIEIENTAQRLYADLQNHPAVLNSLRATRVSADAAALAVALHTGGIGIQDFVIAPAILSLTSMLTESALGRYVNKAQSELKARQTKAVEALLDVLIRKPLLELPQSLDSSHRFNISVETLKQAEHLLENGDD